MLTSRRNFLRIVPAVPFITLPNILEAKELPSLAIDEGPREELIGNAYFDFKDYTIWLDGPQTLENIYLQARNFWKSYYITSEGRDVITYEFPFSPITKEEFELQYGWTFANLTTIKNIRTSGWNTFYNMERKDKWLGIQSLGGIDKTTISYYKFDNFKNVNFFSKSGQINEAIYIPPSVNKITIGYVDRRSEKHIDKCNLSDIGHTSLKNCNGVLRFPISEA